MAEIIPAQDSTIPITLQRQDIDKLAEEGGISLVGKFGSRLLLIVGQIAVARILGPAVFGIFTIGTTIFRLVQIFAPLGLPNGVIWFGSKYFEKDSQKLRGVILHATLLSLFTGAASSIFFFLTATKIAQIYHLPDLSFVIRWFSVSLGFITVLRVTASITRISQIVKYSVILEDLLQPLLFIILVYILHVFNVNLLGALIANLISFATPVLISCYYVYKLFFKNTDKSFLFPISTQALLIYSVPTAFLGFIGTANIWVDRLVVGFYRPAIEVGYYNAASQISMIFIIILTGMASIFAPMIANFHHSGEKGRVNELYRVSSKWGLYIGIPIFIIICFFPKDMMAIFGKEYAASAFILVILSIGQIINLGTGNVGFLLVMTGNQNALLIISVISLILNILLNIIFTAWIGVVGTAISTTLAVILLNITGLIYARHRLNVWPYDHRYVKGSVATVAVIGSAILLKLININSAFINLTVAGLLLYSTFFITLNFIGLDGEDTEVFNLVRAKLHELM